MSFSRMRESSLYITHSVDIGALRTMLLLDSRMRGNDENTFPLSLVTK